MNTGRVMANHDTDDVWTCEVPDPPTIGHPEYPVVDDSSAAVLDEAIVELTLLRSPMGLGDCLADLHAMVSLLAQLRDWLPVVVAGARGQGHTWAEIAGQLELCPSTVRRRYRAPHSVKGRLSLTEFSISTSNA